MTETSFALANDVTIKQTAYLESIPEFIRFNIVESEVQMSSDNKVFTKENLDTYLKELANINDIIKNLKERL